MNLRAVRLRTLGIVLAAALVSGCATLADPTREPGPVPDAEMSLTIVNATDRVIELVVNSRSVGVVQGSSQRVLTTVDLGALPWHAEVRLSGGRTLSELTVASGSVVRTANGSQSIGSRVDLSCGRIDMWAVVPMGGPPPGPGVPGDCDP